MYNSNQIYPILQQSEKGNFPREIKNEIKLQNLSPIIFVERFVLILSIFGANYVSELNLVPTIYDVFYLSLVDTICYIFYREWGLKKKLSLSDWLLFNFLSILALFIPAFVGITIDLFVTLPFVSEHNIEIWTITSIVFSSISWIFYSFLNANFKRNIGKPVDPRTKILLVVSLVTLVVFLLLQMDFQNRFSFLFTLINNLKI